ncbi:hypothetical protein WJR50_31490 [Catalinimonas sp. 4WD22]|uniref:hypothetical protein n=1 Tax=Catalinimonas locisalis TaxID=3133978 RepID=UPI003100F79C
MKFSVYIAGDLDEITYLTKSVDAGKLVSVFMVRVDARLNEKKQRLVLAHEMIHIKQYVKGELKVLDENNVFWKGKKYYGNDFYSQKTPWESEAYRFDGQLANDIKEKPSVHQMPLASNNRP